MARIFITGSSDGLGRRAASRLASQGHTVLLHARSAQRASDALAAVPSAAGCVVADLSSVAETRRMAAEADSKFGPFDAVIHNAGVYLGHDGHVGKDGLPSMFHVNVLAPYVLAASMKRPKRLVMVSSGMHRSGRPRLGKGEGLEKATYSDTKLMDILLANALARRWEGTEVNSLDPGWVPTKLGGWGAPGDIEMGVDTYVTLALGEGEAKGKTGKYFRDSKEQTPAREALDVRLQDRLLEELARISGVALDGE